MRFLKLLLQRAANKQRKAERMRKHFLHPPLRPEKNFSLVRKDNAKAPHKTRGFCVVVICVVFFCYAGLV